MGLAMSGSALVYCSRLSTSGAFVRIEKSREEGDLGIMVKF
jgi:hypothetical protein